MIKKVSILFLILFSFLFFYDSPMEYWQTGKSGIYITNEHEYFYFYNEMSPEIKDLSKVEVWEEGDAYKIRVYCSGFRYFLPLSRSLPAKIRLAVPYSQSKVFYYSGSKRDDLIPIASENPPFVKH